MCLYVLLLLCGDVVMLLGFGVLCFVICFCVFVLCVVGELVYIIRVWYFCLVWVAKGYLLCVMLCIVCVLCCDYGSCVVGFLFLMCLIGDVCFGLCCYVVGVRG